MYTIRVLPTKQFTRRTVYYELLLQRVPKTTVLGTEGFLHFLYKSSSLQHPGLQSRTLTLTHQFISIYTYINYCRCKERGVDE